MNKHDPSDPFYPLAGSRRRKHAYLRGVLLVVLIIAVIIGVLSWIAAPERQPGWGYTEPDIKNKILEMIEQKKPEVTLTPEEFNNLARRELESRTDDLPFGVRWSGADFTWKGNVIQADLRGSWMGIPFGALLDFDAVREGNVLVLNHQKTIVRHAEFEFPHLSPIRISLNKYIPAIVEVQDMTFEDEHITLTFKLDLFTLPRLFLK